VAQRTLGLASRPRGSIAPTPGFLNARGPAGAQFLIGPVARDLGSGEVAHPTASARLAQRWGVPPGPSRRTVQPRPTRCTPATWTVTVYGNEKTDRR
jgi:hypothetical protein